MIAFGIQVLSNSSTSSKTWYVEWRWLGSQNNTTRGTQQGSPVVGRFAYKIISLLLLILHYLFI